jgi:hypothetical protein
VGGCRQVGFEAVGYRDVQRERGVYPSYGEQGVGHAVRRRGGQQGVGCFLRDRDAAVAGDPREVELTELARG